MTAFQAVWSIAWLSIDNTTVSPWHVACVVCRVFTMPHPKKEIAADIEYAQARGWCIVEGGSHAWGQRHCPHNDKECRCGEFCGSFEF